MEAPQLAIVDSHVLMNVEQMIKELMSKVENVESKVNGIVPHEDNSIPSAPDSFHISLKELASMVRVSKTTLNRRISERKKIEGEILPEPRKHEHNGYCYYKKSDLPESLHRAIDRLYSDTSESR